MKAGGGPSAAQVSAAVEDAYTRLIHPSLEREVRSNLSDEAAEGAIQVFGESLRGSCCCSPPSGAKVALGMDPGLPYCKLAVVDETEGAGHRGGHPVPEFKKGMRRRRRT